jgi:hypothetical protein
MSKTSVAAKSNPVSIGAGMATLALALVVALEAGGMYALSQSASPPEAVAAADGTTMYAQAPARPRVGSVEITVIAQAEAPAH